MTTSSSSNLAEQFDAQRDEVNIEQMEHNTAVWRHVVKVVRITKVQTSDV